MAESLPTVKTGFLEIVRAAKPTTAVAGQSRSILVKAALALRQQAAHLPAAAKLLTQLDD
ncbi:hypothetical protein [Chitinimonas sp. BJB300]|uniref:hypothetical protein n=1 Tax=Chitinimonas sp. BJB300 TaxID=1559339 RepID=UPI000C0E3271|nr:hypothetical protein [Chitinimonas sp. BJB300]PHV09622.1 hypothetical protein CSQ89_20690 [Chitinimonas sp. BJB300]TSJ83012.1 hypothetical protein FG002_021815 [Chitinimonas sp. BJB300]